MLCIGIFYAAKQHSIGKYILNFSNKHHQICIYPNDILFYYMYKTEIIFVVILKRISDNIILIFKDVKM